MAVGVAFALLWASLTSGANAASRRSNSPHEMLAALPGGAEVAEAVDAAEFSASAADVSIAAKVLDSPSYPHAMIAALPGGAAFELAGALDVSGYGARSSSSFLTHHKTRVGASYNPAADYPTVIVGVLLGSIIGAVGGNAEYFDGPGSIKCGIGGGIGGAILGLAWDLLSFLVVQKEPVLNEGGEMPDAPAGEVIELPEPSLEKLHQLALTAVAVSDYEEGLAKLGDDLGEQLTERMQEKKARKALDDIVDRQDTERKEPMNRSKGDFVDIQEVLSEGDTSELMTAEAALANNALVTANDLSRVSGENGMRIRGEDLGPAGDLKSFQGDMIPASDEQLSLFQAVWSAAGTKPSIAAGATWTDATVNFCFASDVSAHAKHIFLAAANQVSVAVPCMKFVDVGWRSGSSTSSESKQKCLKSPAIFVQSNPREGCYSYVGMLGHRVGKASQRLQLQDPGCLSIGTAVHELGHALGMAHEQSRPDRDKHVKIHWENIASGKEHNFEVEDKAYTGADYDMLSIMHYDRYAFSIPPEYKPTIEYVGKGVHDELGQRAGLSSYDVKQLVDMYEAKDQKCSGNALAGLGCINKPDDTGKDICDIDKCNSKAASHCCGCGGGIKVQCYEGQDCPKSDPLPDLDASECIQDATHLFTGSVYPCIYTNVCKFNVQFQCPGLPCEHKVRSKSYEIAKCNKMFVSDICRKNHKCKVIKLD